MPQNIITNYFLEVLTPPTTTPISLSEAKEYLKIASSLTADDAVITNIIESAIEVAEKFINQSFIHRTYKITLDDVSSCKIILPRPPISAINSVKAISNSGTETIIDSSLYKISADKKSLELQTFINNKIEIEYIAGFSANSDDIPADIKQAILCLIADIYESKIPNDNSPIFGQRAEKILQRYREVRV